MSWILIIAHILDHARHTLYPTANENTTAYKQHRSSLIPAASNMYLTKCTLQHFYQKIHTDLSLHNGLYFPLEKPRVSSLHLILYK